MKFYAKSSLMLSVIAALTFVFAGLSVGSLSGLDLAKAAEGEKPQTPKTYPKPKLREKKSANDVITGPMYFYSVTHDESTGWIYVIPFCKKIPADEFKTIKKSCKRLSDKGQRCETSKKVELAEAGGPKKKSFSLDYFVFISERACVQDRESYTSGDVVPFH